MRITTLTLLLLSQIGYGQEKKKIDHTAYNDWKSIGAIQQSNSGSLITYETNPHRGDGNLSIQSVDGKVDTLFSRGNRIHIHHQETFVAFSVKPEFDTIRSLKLDKVKEDKFPKDTLFIYYPNTDSIVQIPRVKSFKIGEKSDWIAYLSHDDERPIPIKRKGLFRKKPCELSKTSGTSLYLINAISGDTYTVHSVVSYKLDRLGQQVAYTTSEKGDSDTLTVHHMSLDNGSERILCKKQLEIKALTFDYDGNQLVFVHSTDTNKRKVYKMSYWTNSMDSASVLIDSTTAGMPQHYTVSEHYKSYFSRNGKNLFIGTVEIAEQEPEDSLLATEKARVDVWSGFDKRIQPQQLKSKKRDEKESDMSLYSFEKQSILSLEDEKIDRIRTFDFGNAPFALGYATKPYQKENTWDYPWGEDIHLINLNNGEQKMLKQKQAYSHTISPSGDYFLWYDGPDSNWYSTSTTLSEATVNLTKDLSGLFASDNNGNPYIPHSEGSNGWTLIDDKEYYIINSRFDIWAVCPSNPENSFRLTNGAGAEKQITYRLNRFDYDSTYALIESGIIHGIEEESKSESYSSISLGSKTAVLTELINTPHKFSYFSKAKESDQVLFRRMSFTDYPEIESSDIHFTETKKLSHTNPQQEEYNWGTVEMIEWTSYDGIPLKGLLYKPEDFDSTKSYPMISYFYETYTENIHFHYIPKPTASIVYPTEYVSNGYLIFIPDILYKPGYPAASAYDCIVSGTDHLTQNFSYIDSTRLGLQGQSWGGYQTAQLITMTTKYKAAMAGAPVSNMFSAYGGIRWGSGLSRMFQYEKTQSRIGYTIWEKPELYIENSPIFGLPNVETPLLIMHNDGDGAVPWYQGIELYMGLRRLNQPVWLLNYNGDQHNLMKNANREDLSIRMRQFFDFYLLDAEMPVWMDEGVPAIDKGINYGLELKKK